MIDIIQGSDRTLRLNFTNAEGVAYSLASVTEIEVKFTPTLSKTLTGLQITVISAANGTADVVLDETDTLSLELGQGYGLEIILDFSATRHILQPCGVYNVLAPRY